MKGRTWMWIGLMLAMFVAGFAVSQASVSRQKLQQQTLDNLHSAMKGEAFAYVSYTLYAEQARKNGHPEIADAFENAAKTERFEHFAEEAELAGLVGTDEENLRTAIKGESYEATTMYKQFAEEAASLEDHPAAERFEEIRKDEARHQAMFETELRKLTEASQNKK